MRSMHYWWSPACLKVACKIIAIIIQKNETIHSAFPHLQASNQKGGYITVIGKYFEFYVLLIVHSVTLWSSGFVLFDEGGWWRVPRCPISSGTGNLGQYMLQEPCSLPEFTCSQPHIPIQRTSLKDILA